MVKGLVKLTQHFDSVLVLKGNHDGVDENLPYFDFLNHIEGLSFVTHPTYLENKFLMLPHSKSPEADWQLEDIRRAKYIFCHCTVSGSKSESGIELEGVSLDWFADTKAKIYAGDVHVPQKVGNVEYVGAPYPIRFGDKFHPRAVLLSGDGTAEDLHYPSPKRVTLDLDIEQGALLPSYLQANDQVKVRVHLRRSEYSAWHSLRKEVMQACKAEKIVLAGVELKTIQEELLLACNKDEATNLHLHPHQVVENFGKTHELSEALVELGKTFLDRPLGRGLAASATK